MEREMARWLAGRTPDAEKVLRIVGRAGVERRRLVVPLERLFRQGDFGDRNREYMEQGKVLALEVSRAALQARRVPPQAIDLVVSTSCTGFMIPSVDAHLANTLPFHDAIRRLPITELGCAGGAMALSHTDDILRGRPEELALVVSVELSSLNAQREDVSMAYLVSCALFGDGAAAVLLAGDDSELAAAHPTAPRIVDHTTAFFRDTIDAMGFRLESTGFHMVLDASIPDLLREKLPGALETLVARCGLQLADIDHFLLHPGGRKILDTAEEVLDRGPTALSHSREMLARHGNLSSASILVLLHEFLESGVASPGDRGVLVAFGPGFNAELILLEWPAK
jgi:alkylresorcinol/alkylpyrone synthase